MVSYYSRTTQLLKDNGLSCHWKVEQWNQFTKTRKDLFNIIDMVLLDKEIIGVQVCGQDFSSHVRKITEEHEFYARKWLECNGRLILIGWRKLKVKRGGKAMRWHPRIVEFKLVDDVIFIDDDVKMNYVKKEI